MTIRQKRPQKKKEKKKALETQNLLKNLNFIDDIDN